MRLWPFGNRSSDGAPAPKPADRPKWYQYVGGLFDAARTDRFALSWGTTPITPDELIRRQQRILVTRSRDLANNDPYYRKYLRSVRRNLIGHRGVQLQMHYKRATTGKLDAAINAAIEDTFTRWGKKGTCEVTGAHSWLSLQWLWASTKAQDGEFFLQLLEGEAAGNEWGFAVKAIDPYRCPADYDIRNLKGGGFIRSGIEFNADGRPVAYHFLDDQAVADTYAYTFKGRGYVRIPAEQIVHDFRVDMVGQKRGIPWAVAAMIRLRSLKRFEENALHNAEVGAGKMGIIKYAEGFGPEADEETPIQITAEGGKFIELPEGADLTKWDPAFPDAAIAPFAKHMHRGACAGMNVSYHTNSGDLESVNFSSIRAGTVEERDVWKEEQEHLIESMQIVLGRWMRQALLRNLIVREDGTPIPASGLSRYLAAATWNPRRWEWVDPQADTAANRDAIAALVKAPQDVILEQGGDPEAVLTKIADWYAMAKEKGIPAEALAVAMGAKLTVPTEAPNKEKPQA